jgi:transposase
MRKAYPTDINAEQWALIEPLIPPAKPGGRPRSVDRREIINALFYILSAGCAWRLLPHDLPLGKPSTPTFDARLNPDCGRTSTTKFECGCVSASSGNLPQCRQSRQSIGANRRADRGGYWPGWGQTRQGS